MRILFIIFIIMPILEVWVLLSVGDVIGGLNTVGLVVLTAVIGVYLLRQQSFATVLRARGKLQTGEVPMGEMVEGIFLAVGGALLLTPGFITDTIGFCCLIPGIRRRLVGWGARAAASRGDTVSGGHHQSRRQGGSHDSRTIEGEYRREDDPDK